VARVGCTHSDEGDNLGLVALAPAVFVLAAAEGLVVHDEGQEYSGGGGEQEEQQEGGVVEQLADDDDEEAGGECEKVEPPALGLVFLPWH
jgi:hypothetical protein